MRASSFITVGTALLVSAATPAIGCQLLPPSNLAPSAAKRGITPEDLVTLRDIGPDDLERPRDQVFTLSPDGKRVAFQIRQADPTTNSYCLAMFVLDRGDSGRLVQVDQGGEFLPYSAPSWGYAKIPPTAGPKIITPLWSPDGRWIAYLRRDSGSTQVWRAATDGSGAQPITHLDFDVEGFAWSADGAALVVQGRPALQKAENDITIEGDTGFHFDDRFLPRISGRPFVRDPLPSDFEVVDIASGSVRPATPDEKALVDLSVAVGTPAGAMWSVTDRAGDQAWVASRDPGNISAQTALHVHRKGLPDLVCTLEPCQSVADAWFDGSTRTLYYMRRGRGQEEQEFYRWPAGADAPTRLWRTEDVFNSCTLPDGELLCAEEEITRPRRLMALNLKTLTLRVVFDPNPEFSELRTGPAQYLHWANSYGVSGFGSLVLPPDHTPGQKHPLIVVGYIARGFARGGTGDEYPILALAEKGYAVLTYQTPTSVGYAKGAKTAEEFNRINRVDWMDYRNTAASIDAGIQAVIALGVADENKIGLTGMSYGGSIAQFELVNSHRFLAAALSTCCEEESNASMLAGPGFYKTVHKMGYPGLTDDGSKFWAAMSLRLNAKSVTTPILLQVPDQELLTTTEGVMALQEAGQPVDMYVYPNETHVKWQPLHRLNVYRRYIQWFDFWLRGVEDANPVDPSQYGRWRAFRQSTSNTPSGSPVK